MANIQITIAQCDTETKNCVKAEAHVNGKTRGGFYNQSEKTFTYSGSVNHGIFKCHHFTNLTIA